MSRTTTAAFNAAHDAAHYDEIIFAELQFTSGTTRVCTREHDVVWDGHTWLGRGHVGTISPLQEAGELEPFGVEMTLKVSSELLALALDPAKYKNRSARIWAGLFDRSGVSGYAVVDAPVGPFTFRMDTLEWELGEVGLLRMTAESRMADWQRPRVRRYNNADQQAVHAGDNFFANAEQMSEAEFLWTLAAVTVLLPSLFSGFA